MDMPKLKLWAKAITISQSYNLNVEASYKKNWEAGSMSRNTIYRNGHAKAKAMGQSYELKLQNKAMSQS